MLLIGLSPLLDGGFKRRSPGEEYRTCPAKLQSAKLTRLDIL